MFGTRIFHRTTMQRLVRTLMSHGTWHFGQSVGNNLLLVKHLCQWQSSQCWHSWLSTKCKCCCFFPDKVMLSNERDVSPHHKHHLLITLQPQHGHWASKYATLCARFQKCKQYVAKLSKLRAREKGAKIYCKVVKVANKIYVAHFESCKHGFNMLQKFPNCR